MGRFTIYAFVFLLLSFGCKVQTTKQGLYGNVLFAEGNLMPGPGVALPSPKKVSRTIGFFSLTNYSAVVVGDDAGFFKDLGKKPIKSIESGADGQYKVDLKPGYYSVLVWENGQWYANLTNEKMDINPVEVKKDSSIKLDILINYKAVY